MRCLPDFESLAAFRAYSGNLHLYYRMISSMIEETLQQKKFEEVRNEIAEREPIDDPEFPF